MDLRDLRVFLACVEMGSMTRAAERCHVVQSAVSQAIARLERSCGVRLLDRGHSGVRPTEAGEVLVVHARSAINTIERASEDMHAFAGLERGTVRLGVLHTVAPLVIAPLLGAVRRTHPGLRLAIHEATAGELADSLLAGIIDLAILIFPVYLYTVHLVSLAPIELYIVAPGCDQYLGADVTLRELRDSSWVAFLPNNPGREWLVRSCAGAGFVPKIAAEVGTLQQLKDFVGAGVGLGMVPKGAVELECAAGLLKGSAFLPETSVSLGYAFRSKQDGIAPSAIRRLLDATFPNGTDGVPVG